MPATDPRSVRVVALVGPTAAGKSSLALALAAALGGEVVNADAMQLYRGMDIGTAKLPADQRAGITHHLLDLWAVTERASVVEYQRRARACVDHVLARSVTPVVVGGSGLYVAALLDEFDIPPTDVGVRAALEAELAETGAPHLHARLAATDPVAASAILPTNCRRVVRALEVIELTGRPVSARLPTGRPHYDAVRIALDADNLDERIARRTRAMYAGGLAAETERLVAAGLRAGATARKALGYAQVLDLLDGVLPDEAAAIAQTARLTRRFARRQRSWFRRDRAVRWLDATDSLPLDAALSCATATPS